jgi:VanZ family protein
MLTFLAGLSWSAVSSSSYRTWILAAVSAVAYGGVVEVLQAFCTTDRFAEAGDLLADAIGAAFVVAVVLVLRRLRIQRRAGR